MAKDSGLKERVKGGATFQFFRDGALWYAADDGWEFPVPVSDTTNGQGSSPTFNAKEKGITLMRWMRKHMETEAQWQAEAANP